MPTLSSYVSEDEMKAIETAAAASEEGKVAPYVATAVRQRMERDGTLPGNPKAELFTAAEEVGGLQAAVTILRRSARRRG